MKKLIIAAAIVCAAAMSQAASVDWKATGAKADIGVTVYILTSSQDTWASATEVASKSIGSDVVVAQPGGRAWSTAVNPTTNEAITKSTTALSVVVVSADGTKYATTSVSISGLVYDKTTQPPESSPGTATFSVTGLTYKDFSTVPEPTSGLLLLLGVAGLALRRKQK